MIYISYIVFAMLLINIVGVIKRWNKDDKALFLFVITLLVKGMIMGMSLTALIYETIKLFN